VEGGDFYCAEGGNSDMANSSWLGNFVLGHFRDPGTPAFSGSATAAGLNLTLDRIAPSQNNTSTQTAAEPAIRTSRPALPKVPFAGVANAAPGFYFGFGKSF
jgi:hypothetical protein